MEKKLNIALVSPYAFASEPGGVKDFILGLKSALQKKGCEVSIIAPGSKDAEKKGLVDFVLGIGFKLATDQTEFGASLSRKKTAKRILDTFKPDVIVIHEPFVPSIGHTIISTVLKIQDNSFRPVIIGQFHARREGMSWQLKAAEFIARHFIRRPKLSGKTLLGLSSGYVATINNNLDGRIAVSQGTRRFWQKKLPARLAEDSPRSGGAGGESRRADYRVIYNGIDIGKLTVSGPKINRWKNPPAGGGGKIVLCAGRHDPRKGIDDLINAFNILVLSGHDDIRLKITGKGEMTESLQKQADKLGLQKLVEFVGVLPYEKLMQAYRTADVVVAPSTGGEGFNRTIIEARACGTLVVCTDIKGQNEAIGDDLKPFMAKRKNPRSLSRQILAVLNLSKAEKQRIIKRGIKDVRAHFGWDRIAEEHLAYYKSLISKH